MGDRKETLYRERLPILKLNDELIALLRQPSICYIATSMADGSPQMTQTWADTDQVRVIIVIEPEKISSMG